MIVNLLSHTENPIEIIYRAFRICYSKDVPTEIKIPTIWDDGQQDYYPDYNKMNEFIKSHISHSSPLEHVSFTFAIEGASRITEQQLTRHRLASYSIQSGRYVNKSNSFTIIPPSIQNNLDALVEFLNTSEIVRKTYDNLINLGIPKEDARYITPQGQGTNIIFTMNLTEFRHFYSERDCVKAQWEIKELAKECMRQVKEVVPFADYQCKKCGVLCNECADKGEKI